MCKLLQYCKDLKITENIKKKKNKSAFSDDSDNILFGQYTNEFSHLEGIQDNS